MARRLALFLLLACAVLARRPPQKSSESDSFDPFEDWSDYDESIEPPRSPPPKPNKLILRTKPPKVDVKKTKSENKKNIVKTTTINIESYTNFIVTKKPNNRRTTRKPLGSHNSYVIELDDSGMEPVKVIKRPYGSSTHRPEHSTKKAVPTTRRPTTRRATTRRPTTRRVTPRMTTRRPYKITKAPLQYKTECPPKKGGWLSSFFQDNKSKKPKKTSKPGWFSGIYVNICT